MDVLAIDDKDVENGVDEFFDFVAKLWDGLMALFDVMPPIVIGIIAFIGIVAVIKHILS